MKDEVCEGRRDRIRQDKSEGRKKGKKESIRKREDSDGYDDAPHKEVELVAVPFQESALGFPC